MHIGKMVLWKRKKRKKKWKKAPKLDAAECNNIRPVSGLDLSHHLLEHPPSL
jgi:hypothetical protein